MRADIVQMFELDSTVTHLNHASFGAVARRVREAQDGWRTRIEVNPLHFYRNEAPELIAGVRREVTNFIGAQYDSVALVRNVTEAASVVLRTLAVGPGTEVVTSSHGYGAVDHAVRACGATVRKAQIAPFMSTEEIAAAFAAQVTDRTALVVVDQLTSPTAWRLPVREVVEAVTPVPVYVDAAHVAGTVAVDVQSLGSAFWATNLHKWAYTPRGCGAFWVAPQWRDKVQPPSLGWACLDGFPNSFDTSGTIDLAGWLAAPTAFDVWRELGGWDDVAERSRLLERGVAHTEAELGADPVAPQSSSPTMRIIRLPTTPFADLDGAASAYDRAHAMGIEAQFVPHDGESFVRLSAAPYNDEDDYARCAAVLVELFGRA